MACPAFSCKFAAVEVCYFHHRNRETNLTNTLSNHFFIMKKTTLRSAFRLRNLLALFAFFSMAVHTWAQLSEGKTYYIKSCATGKVLSNGDSGDKDVSLRFESISDQSAGQKWTLKSTGNADEFIIVSSYYPTMAVDAAPGSPKWYYAVQWTADVNSTNQKFKFVSVDDKDTYNIVWSGDTDRRFYEKSDSRLNISNETASDAGSIQFEMIETTPQAEVKRLNWQNEKVFQEHKLDGHATFMPYANTDKLHADKARYDRPWVDPTGAEWMTLNGVWNLKWTTDMGNIPQDDFYADAVDATAWDTITVPSCLEMKGYGNPYYINDQYPFEDSYPLIQMTGGCQNSVASYRRHFTLPEGWETGKRVILHFDGIYSAAYVWVNGQYVGYTQGSNNDAEFDLTGKVRQGDNNIAVQVYRFSDGSYLEDQDMWRMSGIHRDVYLYATPSTYVRDHVITDDLAAPYTSANLNVKVEMTNPDAQATNKQVRVRLISPEGNQVAQSLYTFSFAEGDTLKSADVQLSGLSDLQPWTAEAPNLYTVEVAQFNADGTEEMAFATKYGFRKIAIVGGQVQINGKRVLFRGVNTQDTHPAHGRTIDVATMLRDVTMMKQANINTVRTSHYPRQAKMNAMFDYYGLYCMDEADVECHYNWFYGANNINKAESWRPQFIDRTKRMAQRDRNFPSVIFWSLGNESGAGANLKATYDMLKELDPSRPVHYEGATRAGESYSDLYSEMYPNMTKVQNNAASNSQRKPYFMCEYAHAMGNAVGNLKQYWDAIISSNYGIGGCIWDWVDQSIYRASDIKAGTLTQNGKPKYYTGYDFPGPTQGNFVNNGLISADRAWSPELVEVKAVYQPIYFNFTTRRNNLSIVNYNSFTDLDQYYIVWSVLKNGEEVESGTLEAPSTEPFATASNISLPITSVEKKDGNEYLLNVQLVLKEATSWAEAGYPIAQQQFVLQDRNATLDAVEPKSDVVTTGRNAYKQFEIRSGKLYLQVDYQTGHIRQWRYGDYSLVASTAYSPIYDNFRWVENDEARGNSLAKSNGITKSTLVDTVKVNANGNATFKYTDTGSYCDVTYTYTIYPGGVIDMKSEYSPHDNDNLRRIGTKLTLPAALEMVDYYARGPWENYVDRCTGSLLGRYQSTVTDFMGNTPRAQSCGNHQDMRFVTLTDTTAQFSLRMESQGQVSFSVLHVDDYTMANTRHLWETVSDPRSIFVHLDYYQKGLGNASCGNGTGTLSQFCCPTSGTYTNTVRFTCRDKDDLTAIHTPVAADNASLLSVKAANGQVICTGSIAAGTAVRVYDLGGSTVAAATAADNCSQLTLSLAAQPHGIYIVKVDNKAYKVVY